MTCDKHEETSGTSQTEYPGTMEIKQQRILSVLFPKEHPLGWSLMSGQGYSKHTGPMDSKREYDGGKSLLEIFLKIYHPAKGQHGPQTQ